MGISHSEAYAAAGVDIEAGYQGVKMMNRYVQRTLTADVISDLGGFGGLFSLDLHGLEKPVLVSGTDGVGTKQRIAQLMDRHNTVGIDCVAMCVNDIICCGAKPLFFLDYIAIGKNIPEKVVSLVSGVSEGCVRAGCALIGGETAEHPGTMKPDDYDLAGFAVGIVEKSQIIDGSRIKPGDVVLGLASSGPHSNGFSLIRKVVEVSGKPWTTKLSDGKTLADAVMEPTRIYVKPVLEAMKSVTIKGMAHITGGGLLENIPRVLPEGTQCVIKAGSWKRPAVFDWLQEEGHIEDHEMYRVFNNGIGMAVIVAAEDAEKAQKALKAAGETVYRIGVIEALPAGEALCVVR